MVKEYEKKMKQGNIRGKRRRRNTRGERSKH